VSKDAQQTMKDLQNTRKMVGRVNVQEYKALVPKKTAKKTPRKVARTK
jgi:hypothetical protein